MKSKYLFCPLCATRLVVSMHPGHELKVEQELNVCPKEGCGFTHWNNPLPVVVTLVARRHKLALVKRRNQPGKGLWCPPCGFVDELESPQVAARRETFEEAHLFVDVHELPIAIASPHGVNENISFFVAKWFRGILEAGDDAEDSGWFSADDLPQLAFSTHRDVIAKWFDRPTVKAWRYLAKALACIGMQI